MKTTPTEKLTEVRAVRDGSTWAWAVVIDGEMHSSGYPDQAAASRDVLTFAIDRVGRTGKPVLVVIDRGAYIISEGTYPQPKSTTIVTEGPAGKTEVPR